MEEDKKERIIRKIEKEQKEKEGGRGSEEGGRIGKSEKAAGGKK